MHHPAAVLDTSTPAAGDFRDLEDAGRAYVEASTSASTRRGYTGDWARFEAWCQGRGVQSMPAADAVCAAYVVQLAEDGRKPATIDRALAAIRKAHRLAGLEAPTGEATRMVRRGVRRSKGTAQTQAAPVLAPDLRAMVAGLEDSPAGLRDRALLLLGFAGAFRRAELAGLRVEDVREAGDRGVVVTLRASKTDQEGQGREVAIPFGRSELACPVRALAAWREAGNIDAGPLFRPVDRHGNIGLEAITGRSVARVVKRAAELAGLDPAAYSGHSLRAGLATSAALAGASERAIMRQTGHNSTTMVRRYIRSADLWRDNAASAVL